MPNSLVHVVVLRTGKGGGEWRLTVWEDWTEHSAALVPDEAEEDQVHSVLVWARPHAAGSSWMTANGAASASTSAAASAAAADWAAAGLASDRPLASLHGSFHRSTVLRHTANWKNTHARGPSKIVVRLSAALWWNH